MVVGPRGQSFESKTDERTTTIAHHPLCPMEIYWDSGNAAAAMIETCGDCGFRADTAEFVKHDCYWIWRERLWSEKRAGPIAPVHGSGRVASA